jgi:hypothetical protein
MINSDYKLWLLPYRIDYRQDNNDQTDMEMFML